MTRPGVDPTGDEEGAEPEEVFLPDAEDDFEAPAGGFPDETAGEEAATGPGRRRGRRPPGRARGGRGAPDRAPHPGSEGRREPPRPSSRHRILYQGGGLIAYDKPAGVPIHWGTDHPQGLAETLEEWLHAQRGPLGLEPGKRVRPLHRLDLEASGVVLLATEREVASAVQAAFEAGVVRKRYLAVVAGPVKEGSTIRGKVRTRVHHQYRWLPAELAYRRLAGDERLSLVEVFPEGGRTHQIRALFAAAGRPLAGDLRYGRPKPARQFLEKFGVGHLLLHAAELGLPEGITGPARTFAAPLPELFRTLARAKGWKLG